MLDLRFVRENPEIVKENIKKKFQDQKLPLVDEVIELDKLCRAAKGEADELRGSRNRLSKQIGALMAQGKRDEAEEVKAQVSANAARLAELEKLEEELGEKIKKIMMVIPNIIDPSVPIGRDDSENVEIQRFGEPVVPDFEVPYHTEIMEKMSGIDLDSARKVAGNGFYYLMGDIARLHSAVISYARDFMIDRGFTYCVPPFMIRSDVVTGVMSFAEMDAMMYKIEGEDLYLIGTSEHSMIGKFIDTIIQPETLPLTLTSYSPCFRKATCGQMMPTKPMMPRLDTHAAVISEASSSEKKRRRETFTPMLPAAASPLKRALYRHASAENTASPGAAAQSMRRSVLYVARPRSPKFHTTAAERPTSVA